MDEIKKIIKGFKILRSLRARIFTIVFLAGIIPCMIMKQEILKNYEAHAVSLRTSDVQTQLNIIANHLITYNYLADTSLEVINAEMEQLSNLYDGRVLVINKNFKVVKDTYGISEGKTVISEEVVRCFRGEEITSYDKKDGFIEITIPILNMVDAKRQEEIQGVLLCSISTGTIALTVSLLERKAFVLEVVLAILILLCSWMISKFLLLPFQKVTKAISEVKEGFTDEALSVPDYEETQHIVDAFNKVLRRMRTLDQSRQEFVSNVSHELKTPLTSMKVLADSLIGQSQVPEELYQEFMEDIAAEIERENRIINDLLSLVKVDKTKGELNIQGTDMNALLELLMKRLGPIARKENIELILESNRPVLAEVDEVKITLACSNLIENAIKYNRPEGWVKVSLDADHQFATITIEDSGIGIAKEELEHIFERFYRVDKSHSGEIRGSGLGLSITRNIILMHRGAIQVSSVLEEGTTFLVKIPLTYSK